MYESPSPVSSVFPSAPTRSPGCAPIPMSRSHIALHYTAPRSEWKLTLAHLDRNPFQLSHLLHGVSAPFSAEATVLRPPERNVRLVGYRRVVYVYHAGLQPQSQIHCLLQVVPDHAGCQAIRSIVGNRQGLLGIPHTNDGSHRPE